MPSNPFPHIMLIAGEASGDRHGANLINAFKSKYPDVRFTGLGGPLMRVAGQEQLYDIKDLAVLGLTEVLKKLFFFRKVFRDTLAFVERESPHALVLIDYPGFNVRLAEALSERGRGVKVVYYISPQVWAWGKNRVKKIGRTIEKMLVVFPFEEALYKEEGVPVSFVGHPLMDELKDNSSKEDIRRSFSLNREGLIIGLLPGSRTQEVKLILPIMLKTSVLLRNKFNASFLIPLASSVDRKVVEEEIQKFIPGLSADEVMIVEGGSERVIKASDLIISASGTATLEAGILERPMVIIYRVPLLSYFVLRRIIKIPNIGMVNILLKEEVCPEFIQYEARPIEIFKTCSRILEDADYREKMLNKLRKIRPVLGGPGAGMMAAEDIWRIAYG